MAEYMMMIKKFQEEEEGLDRMLEAKELDIAKLQQENEKWLYSNG